jgi:hypothetical protein
MNIFLKKSSRVVMKRRVNRRQAAAIRGMFFRLGLRGPLVRVAGRWEFVVRLKKRHVSACFWALLLGGNLIDSITEVKS